LLTGPQIILTLKILVVAVTILLLASLVALLLKRPRLHGHINTAFFVLTMLTVVAFEGLLQWGIDVSAAFDPAARQALRTHLWFAVPSALLLPAMIVTGKMRRKRAHLALAVVFLLLWTGTVVTGLGLPN
jgi:FtsH-binding integral membrane protein